MAPDVVVLPGLDLVGVGDQQARRGDAPDVLEIAALRIGVELAQGVRDLLLVDLARNVGERMQALGRRGNDQPVGAQVIAERAVAELVARGDEALAGRVPGDERELADPFVESVGSPALPAAHGERGVREQSQLRRIDPQRRAELLAVVEAAVEHHGVTPACPGHRLHLPARLRRIGKVGIGEGDLPHQVHGLLFRAVNGECARDALDVAALHRPAVSLEDDGNSAHG